MVVVAFRASATIFYRFFTIRIYDVSAGHQVDANVWVMVYGD
jgi:hypothetical protein